MRVSQRTINLPLLLIAGFALALAALHHPVPPGPRYSELLQARDLLVSEHVQHPRPDDLMRAAWLAALEFAKTKGIPLDDVPLPDSKQSTPGYESSFIYLLSAAEGVDRRGELVEVAIGAMASSMRDVHTWYAPEKEWKQRGAEFGAYQFTPRFLYRSIQTTEGIFVWDVTAGSRAMKAGLRMADTIVEVNGVSTLVNNTRPLEVKKHNRLIVLRPGMGRLVLNIEPEVETMHPFDAHMVGDVAYFLIYAFPPLEWRLGDDRFNRRLIDAMDGLADHKPKGWVIDLRGNRGGYPETVAVIAGALGVRGISSEQSQGSGYRSTVAARGPSIVGNEPIAVLIDRGTVSAGEVFALNLKENGGRLFGANTRGGVRGIGRFELNRGGGLGISVTNVYAGNRGINLEGVGVAPDEEIELKPEQVRLGRDNVLERALEWLGEEATKRLEPAAQR